MNAENKLCPKNYQVWVAFLMGMVVIVISMVVFDQVSDSRYGSTDNRLVDETIVDQRDSMAQPGAAAELTSGETSSDVFLGIEVSNATSQMTQQLGLDISEGVFITRVLANSPAQEAGVEPGDILFEFDHREVDDVKELIELMNKAEPGERIKLALIRDDSRIVIYVVLEEAVSNKNLSVSKVTGDVISIAGDTLTGDQRWGVVIAELNDQLRKTYKIPDDKNGVVVVNVVSGSAAASAGIVKGDLIQRVDKIIVENLTDFFKALQISDNSVILYVYRDNSALLINMTASIPYTGSQVYKVAQEGIGMNRPLYVPGYDQTQSGDPDDKTKNTVIQ
ncbi:MAG: PDZ domain-containing protein [Thermodesulfobacteriota bacterium]|nr:PDZ domain-containing protein [Thermodesulfobacteriota bacterium]